MGLFYNPIDGPPSQKQVTGIILYVILALISVWATGQSLSLTFDLPIIVSYFVAGAIVFIMAAMLGIIKDSIEDRKKIPLIIGLLVFFLTWFISLATNTHNFYLKGSLRDIQELELKEIKTDLEGLKVNSNSIISGIIATCNLNISNHIRNYKAEVVNPLNSGHGPKADSLKREVEVSMPGSSFPIPSGSSWFTSLQQKRNLADKMGSIMAAELELRTMSMSVKKDTIDKIIMADPFSDVLNDVNGALSGFFDSNIKDNRKVISESYQLYNGLKTQINNILLTGFLDCTNSGNSIISSIPQTPGSIKLEHIANTYEYVQSKNEFFKSEFLFSFLIALGVDLGAIAIFYYMVLKQD